METEVEEGSFFEYLFAAICFAALVVGLPWICVFAAHIADKF